ncbi:MAG: cation:proton antiporter [Roseitalea sp.]|nr:cation:proton antiporter [Roseitalea sp.]MBO6721398.1 cation:proton antiporter [Roseitalea sp.]MBO6744583.1 cation:proton antiporter [Roseitalea sp.]
MTDLLLLTFIFLVAGVAAVPVASRLGLGSVLGYLIAGIVISPVLALLQVDVIAIQHIAEFGVVMMLFLVGLELEPKLLWSMRGRLLGLGGGQVGLTTLAVMAVSMLLGQPWTIALAIGLVFALSSTAIVLQTLNEKGLMKSDGGESSFSVLLFQDIAVIPMLALIPLLAMPDLMDTATQAVGHGADAAHGTDAGHGADGGHGEGGGDHGSGMSLVAGLPGWQAALVTLAAIGFVVVGGSVLTRPLFRFIAVAQLRELFTATALMMVVGIALLMSLVGLSPALGTFLAGVVLANSEYRHELEADIEPFKGLLLGLFFITVGAGINFTLLFDNLAVTVALTLGLMALKVGVLLALAIVFKIGGADRWLFALGLAQAGEFGFVLLSFTVANAVIPEALADQLLLVVALSMLLTPALFIAYDRLIAPRFGEAQAREDDDIDRKSPVIIAGRGRVGGIVDRMLTAAGYTPTVIDFSSRQIENMSKFGAQVYFGDATRPDLLAAAGIAEAKLLVVAIDDKEQISEVVTYVMKNYPDVHVIARAIDRDHVYHLYAAGCRDIIRETYDSSLRMGRSAFEALGFARAHADAMTEAFQDMDRRAMIAAADVYDLTIPPTENEAYLARIREIMGPWQAELGEQMRAIASEGASGAPAPDRGALATARDKAGDV